MPAFPPASLLGTLVHRSDAAGFSPSSLGVAANATVDAFQVVCAWPVSGQYGPGSRALYYVLVAACVLARKTEWLRNACLAAALLFPAVAALHGIVLAAVHVDGAVDMDVYGAFQLCSIGILAAPVTVRLSRTYFYDPGRNTIFVWTGLILAGLLSLTVEFYRINTSDCMLDDFGNPIPHDVHRFLDSESATCGLTCSIDAGPYSPMRGGAANNIYVIPAPDKLNFGTATLLAAACCIPAILSLVSMLFKILEINWKSRFGEEGDDARIDQTIEGTNGATVENMKGINTMIRFFLSVVEIPLFVGAVLAILIIGEMNFFSRQVRYQTEPITNIGGWAPIVGASLAALGSLYLLLAADVEAAEEEANTTASMHHCNCSHHYIGGERPMTFHARPSGDYEPSIRGARSINGDVFEAQQQETIDSPAMQEIGIGLLRAPSTHSLATTAATDTRLSFSSELTPGMSRPSLGHGHQAKRSSADIGNRRKVAKTLIAIGNNLGAAAHDWFDDSEFKRGPALDFPEVPGEQSRNRELAQIRERYNMRRDDDGNATPGLRRERSIAGSFTGSVISGLGIELDPTTPTPASPQTPHASTFPAERTSSEPQYAAPPSSSGPTRGGPQVRRKTLEVPSPVHHSHTRNSQSMSSAASIVTVPRGQSSPAIVVSSDLDTPSPAHTSVFKPQAPLESSEPTVPQPLAGPLPRS